MSDNSPLKFVGVGNLLDREYRNSPAYQWGRELARNGIEANASTIRFGVEWEAVKALGVYRLQYSDDGHGMNAEQLREYMLTLGKGGKVVGGPHDNYALGSRMTLLPWNPAGVVVISVVNGQANMVKMMFDPDASNGDGEYVLEQVEQVDADDEDGPPYIGIVYPPYVDPEGNFDWNDTIPDFIRKAGHGTTFVMLGRKTTDNTVDGDPDREERHRWLGRKYFNTRFWDIPAGVTLQVIEMPEDSVQWPKSPEDKAKYQNRSVRGARSLVEYRKSSGEEFVADHGTVTLRDATKVHWWLRTEPRVDTGGLGAASGYIAVLYRGELYGQASSDSEDGDTRTGAAVYRQFGISSDSVRRRVFLIVEPSEYSEETGAPGVAPSTGRADLYWMGAGQSPRSVKPADWSEEFDLPQAILDAINAEYAARPADEDREERLKKVMDRFTKRWRAPRARVDDRAPDTTTEPTSGGTAPRPPIDSPTPVRRRPRSSKRVVVRGRGGKVTIGTPGTGITPARKTSVTVGLPGSRWVSEADINEKGMIAAWEQPHPGQPGGCVLLDKDHPVIRSQVEYWQAQYPKALWGQIEKIVMDAYEEVAIAKVSHMSALTGTVFDDEQRRAMLENPALTTSLLGLISEDAVIGPRIGGLGAKKRVRREGDESDSQSEPAA